MFIVWSTIFGLMAPNIATPVLIDIHSNYKIKELLNLSDDGVNYTKHHLGNLRKGSIIEIPDDVLPLSLRGQDGDIEEKKLIEWLKNPADVMGGTKGLKRAVFDRKLKMDDGQIRRTGYYFPVIIKSSSPDSELRAMRDGSSVEGKRVYLPLEVMALNKGTISLVDDAVLEERIAADKKRHQTVGMTTQEYEQSSDEHCEEGCKAGTHNPKLDNPAKDLLSQIKRLAELIVDTKTEQSTLKNVKKLQKGKKGTAATFVSAVESNYNNTCDTPPPFEKFKQAVVESYDAHKIQPAVLLGVLTQESMGKCKADGDGGSSMGPFQVRGDIQVPFIYTNEETGKKSIRHRNYISLDEAKKDKNYNGVKLGNKTYYVHDNLKWATKKMNNFGINLSSGVDLSKYDLSKESDRAKLKKQLRNNPKFALELSVAMLYEKYELVNGERPNLDSTNNNKLFSKLDSATKTKWRRAFSAYNGGQRYIYDADKSFKQAQAEHKDLDLDKDNWDHYRAFMFRKFLKDNDITSYNKRNRSFELLNITYAEQLAGDERGEDDTESSGIIYAWERELFPEAFKEKVITEIPENIRKPKPTPAPTPKPVVQQPKQEPSDNGNGETFPGKPDPDVTVVEKFPPRNMPQDDPPPRGDKNAQTFPGPQDVDVDVKPLPPEFDREQAEKELDEAIARDKQQNNQNTQDTDNQENTPKPEPTVTLEEEKPAPRPQRKFGDDGLDTGSSLTSKSAYDDSIASRTTAQRNTRKYGGPSCKAKGTNLPEDFRNPEGLVNSGWVVRIGDSSTKTKTSWFGDNITKIEERVIVAFPAKYSNCSITCKVSYVPTMYKKQTTSDGRQALKGVKHLHTVKNNCMDVNIFKGRGSSESAPSLCNYSLKNFDPEVHDDLNPSDKNDQINYLTRIPKNGYPAVASILSCKFN